MMLQKCDILKHRLEKKENLFSHERIKKFKLQKINICKMNEFDSFFYLRDFTPVDVDMGNNVMKTKFLV